MLGRTTHHNGEPTMARKNRKTKDNVGVVYLFTNDCYEKEDTYKYGITINPFERKRIQKNSTPPTHPFYDRIIIFSPAYKKIEQWLENKFKKEGYLLEGDGGKEWVKADFNKLLQMYKEAVLFFPETEMCFGGKRYRNNKGTIEECKLPNCRLDLLGIIDGKKIKCIQNGETFEVQDNKILVGDSKVTLSTYMNQYYKRSGSTNEHNGYQYFTYNGILIYDMWQSLVGAK